MTRFILRPEQDGDTLAIYALTARAFAPMPFAAGDEQDLINALRDAGALGVSLVAERADQIIGHIAFSPMTPRGWFALGPVSTDPEFQKQGIGAALIRQGLEDIRQKGAFGCALTGNPNFYQRFGFALDPALCPAAEPPEYFMTLSFGRNRPDGPLAFHPLFYAKPGAQS